MRVNLKKVGAIVAGATILASSAAFAGLMFGSTTLVDDNGAPVAKVVIGSKAAPSDAVAAALIAGKIVSSTYKSETLTAQPVGTASCGAANVSASGGTCAITNKQVTLDITVPGSVAAGTWTGNNLIGDYLDRTLQDRAAHNVGVTTDTVSGYPTGTSDTTTSANPFTTDSAANGGTLNSVTGNPEAVYMYQVSGNALTSLADLPVTDTSSNQNFEEHQAIWISGDNAFNANPNAVVGDLNFLAYSLKFDGPGSKTVGIPVCDNSVNSDYSACEATPAPSGTSVDDETSTHKVQISFLGENWIISEMTPPTGTLTNENTLVNGGDVKLAEESQSGILNVGDKLTVDNLNFQLQDLEAISGGGGTAAIIAITDANGNVLKQDTVTPGTTTSYTINGKSYKFHVYKVAPGYTFGAKWADVAIFSNELELQDNSQLDQTVGDNPDYHVALGWKNLDATSGSSGQTKPDALRTIIIYADQSDLSQMMPNNQIYLTAGESVPLVQVPVVWQLKYTGLSLTSANEQSLTFNLYSSTKTMNLEVETVGNVTAGETCVMASPYMDVNAGGTTAAFTLNRNDPGQLGGQLTDREFFVALNTDTPSAAVTCTGAQNLSLAQGTVFMRESANSQTYGFANTSAMRPIDVQYEQIGDGNTAFNEGGVITVQPTAGLYTTDGHIGQVLASKFAGISTNSSAPGVTSWSSGVNAPTLFFAIAEKAGVGTSSNFVDYYMFPVSGTTVASYTPTLEFNAVDSSSNSVSSNNNYVLYAHAMVGLNATIAGPVTKGIALQQNGYVSERGSTFENEASTTAQFLMATQLGTSQWMLAPSTVNASSSSTSTVTLPEGKSTTIGGVTVKVDSITQDVGACSAAGGAAACTADMSPVSAVIMPDNKASVTATMPYDYSNYGNLVILDQDAVGVNTLISVGGDQVNTVTASLLQGSAVDWTATPQIVKEVVQGSKIVVAGSTAADTLTAAQTFVSQVKKV